MNDLIAKIASMLGDETPVRFATFDSLKSQEPTPEDCPSDKVVFDTEEQEPNGHHSSDDVSNYMFFNNLESMRDMIDEILSLDKHQLDQMLSAEHDWASDHISSAQENIQQVYSWLASENDCDSCH
jgi:hypothetical protein